MEGVVRAFVLRGNMAVLILVLTMLAGCAGTKEGLERHGIEVKGGKVFRVFRF
jgi:hypothetical protein